MVIGDNFIWLHLGKTAGRSTSQSFDSIKDRDVRIIDGLPQMHYNLEEACQKYNLNSSVFETVLMNIRPLHSWIQSLVNYRGLDVHKYGDIIRSGQVVEHVDYWIEYFRVNNLPHTDLGGGLVSAPADNYISHYVLDGDKNILPNLKLLRMEYLEEDIKKFFGDYCDDTLLSNILSKKIGKLSYEKLQLTTQELRIMRLTNPIWTTLELEAY
jgi:hypothetical protein